MVLKLNIDANHRKCGGFSTALISGQERSSVQATGTSADGKKKLHTLKTRG